MLDFTILQNTKEDFTSDELENWWNDSLRKVGKILKAKYDQKRKKNCKSTGIMWQK